MIKQNRYILILVTTAILITTLLHPMFLQNAMAAEHFTPEPRTDYAKQYIAKCDKQQWFIDEMEAILNQQGKSLNTIENKEDFANIYAIGLANKNIEGKIPKAIGELCNLEYLYLSQNKLSGTIPKEIFTLNKLKNLDLSQNNITGVISENISNFRQLNVLLLHSNNLEGGIPVGIGEIITLENVDLGENELTGSIPSNLGNLVNLKFFSVAGNNISGVLPKNLSNITGLKVLLLSNNSIGGNLKGIVSGTSAIELIDCRSNLFVGDIDDNLLSAINGGTIADLTGNYLSGDNVKGIVENWDNLIEGLEGQNQLKMPKYVHGAPKSDVNIARHLKSYDPTTMEMKREMLNLPVGEYTLKITPEIYKTKIKLTGGSNGELHLTSLDEIDEGNPAHIEISITQNEGRPYSVAKFIFYTVKGNEFDFGDYDRAHAVKATEATEKPVVAPALPSTSREDDDSKGEGVSFGGYINGYPDGTFRPEGKITREEFAQILYSIGNMGKKTVDKTGRGAALFGDVGANRWSVEAIGFASENKLMVGYTDGNFKPEGYLTRGEFATAICNLRKLEKSQGDGFSDVGGHWAKGFIYSAYEAGFVSGYPYGSFEPDKNITRAETVSSMNRVLGVKIDKAVLDKMENPFVDLDKGHWAYYDVLAGIR